MKKLMLVGLVSLPLVSGCATKMETGTVVGALTGGALAYGLGQDSSKKELWTVPVSYTHLTLPTTPYV